MDSEGHAKLEGNLAQFVSGRKLETQPTEHTQRPLNKSTPVAPRMEQIESAQDTDHSEKWTPSCKRWTIAYTCKF